jgi:hypothetical protein
MQTKFNAVKHSEVKTSLQCLMCEGTLKIQTVFNVMSTGQLMLGGRLIIFFSLKRFLALRDNIKVRVLFLRLPR